jgi:uracil-DNA glycosylase family 4
MALTQPISCGGCPLQLAGGAGFMEAEGLGTTGVMAIAEALGEHEYNEGLPLRPNAPAGSVYERSIKRAGLDRTQLVTTNMVKCFVSPRTAVFTDTGYRQMSDIQVGGLVLTHQGRFRRVLNKPHLTDPSPRIVLTMEIGGGYGRKPFQVQVTQDHRFWLEGEWIFARDLIAGAWLTGLGERCVVCDSVFYRGYAHAYKSLPFCSTNCHNRHAANAGREKLQAFMREAYAKGDRDPFLITAAANARVQDMVAEGWKPKSSVEGRQRQRLAAAVTRELIGHNTNGSWIGEGERAIAAILESAGRDYTSQFALDGYNFDFHIKGTKILVEVDGNGAKLNSSRHRIQEIKDGIAERAGYSVLHVDARTPQAVLFQLANDEHEYPFTPVRVLDVERRAPARLDVYTLTVEGDESYVARGLVNHNCRPPRNLLENQSYEVGAVNHCRQYMDAEIERFRPKVLLAMGGIPLRYLTGYAGKKRTITNVRGFYLDGTRYTGIPVVPTYHPSCIQRDKPNLLGVFRLDILRAVALARASGAFTRPRKSYSIFPPREAAEAFLADCHLNPHLPICYDIETEESISGVDESDLKGLVGGGVIVTKVKDEYADTPEHLKPENEDDWQTEETLPTTRITQIQFSLRPGEAIVLPWDRAHFSEIALKILALPNPKTGWNIWQFDDPVLYAHGARKIGGTSYDMMWAWHHQQPDLPRGLQYACSFYIPEAEPWKHRAEADPGGYGGDDVAYLRGFGQQILDNLRQRGLWQGYQRHIVQLNTILVEASRLGIHVDEERRVALGEEVDRSKAEVDVKLQEIVPLELRNVEPKEGYVNPTMALKRQGMNGQGLEPGETWGQRTFIDKKEGGPVERWVRIQPFLPNSGQQILRFIKHRRELEIQEKIEAYKKSSRYASLPESAMRAMAERNCIWKVPKEFKTDKETTAKKELERLGTTTKDPFFGMVIEHREYGKLKSTYVDGWAPAADEAVHTTFTYAPATGQLSSRRPNVQNAPKHGKLAKAFRRMIRARPGHRLVEIDKTAFHALTLGFEARDPNYMRLAAKDIHSFVAANFLWMHNKKRLSELGLPPNPERWTEFPDDELSRVLGVIKKNESTLRNKKAKPSILGIGFGMGDQKCFDMNRESFESLAEVKKFSGIIKGLFKPVFKYQDATRELAHRQGFLVSLHGYIRWFFDIYHWDPKYGKMRPGKDSEAAIAFRPANNAFGMIKEEMLELDGRPGWGASDEEILVYEEAREKWSEDELRERSMMVRYGFVNQIHDALVFDCPNDMVEECLENVVGVMQSPSKVLIDPVVAPRGLVCGVEAMVSPVGGDWTELEVVHVRPRGVAA